MGQGFSGLFFAPHFAYSIPPECLKQFWVKTATFSEKLKLSTEIPNRQHNVGYVVGVESSGRHGAR
jgi:hypothetical protein